MEPVERGSAMKDYLRSQVNPTLVKGLTELCHEKPDDPLVREHHYTKIITVTILSTGVVGSMDIKEQSKQTTG